MYVDEDGFEFGSSKLESYSLASKTNQVTYQTRNSPKTKDSKTLDYKDCKDFIVVSHYLF